MSYQQLTEGQRYQLSVLRAQGMSILMYRTLSGKRINNTV